MKRLGSAVFLFVFLLLPSLAFAQTQRNPCYYTSANPGPGNGCIPVSSVNPLPVAATATIGGGFTDAATGTPISATTLGVTGTLPVGAVVTAFNVGTTNTAYCKLGASATVNDIAIPPASWFAFQAGANTQLTCITSASTTTVNMVGGSGLPTGSGGGGGGSSGGGGTASSFDAAFPATGTAIGLSDGTNMKAWLTALIQAKSGVNGNNMGSVAPWLWNGVSFDAATGTAALGQYVQAKAGAYAAGAGVDGWDLTEGAKADAAYAGSGSASTISLLKGIYAAATSPLAAGTNTIGSVKQTDGTTVVLTDPCQGVAKTYTPINISASGLVKIITGTAAKKTYICHIDLVTNTANNVALTEGTGTNCATGTAGVAGGTTAASGWNFSANGGISIGMGGYAALGTATNADDVCLNPSAATQLSGQVVWVQQ